MQRRIVILCTLLGCARPAALKPLTPSEPPIPPTAVAATSPDEPGAGGSVERDSDDTAPPTRMSEPASAPLVIADDEVPEHARLEFSPRALGKQRALIRHAGALYTPSSLVPLTNAGDRRWILDEVPVLDSDVAGRPRRPRVLCEDEVSRLGVAVDAQDLATTVRADAFVGVRSTPPERLTSRTPGVRLAGGSEVSVQGPSVDGATEIVYEGLLLRARGFVASDAIDVVYTPGELADDLRRNGELRRNVRFLDAPGGVEIATTERPDDISNEMHVFRLGPAKDGHVLVRYQEHESFVVGWIRSEDVEPYPARRSGGGGGGGGMGSGTADKRIDLARGTRLVPVNSTEVIGVVTKSHAASCASDCDGPNPKVRIFACSHVLTLRAVP